MVCIFLMYLIRLAFVVSKGVDRKNLWQFDDDEPREKKFAENRELSRYLPKEGLKS